MRLFLKAIFCVVLMMSSVIATAQDLPNPTGEVILTISGNVGVTNQEGKAVFDLQMLQSLVVKTYETHTPWSENSFRFKGATFKSVLEAAQIPEGSTLSLYALDGYEAHLTWEEATEFLPILAFAAITWP